MKKFFTTCLMAMVAVLVMAQFPTRVYLCGPAGPGWATEQWPMFTEVDANNAPTGVYEWIGDLQDGQIKFLYGSSWEPAYVATVDGEALTAGDHSMQTRLNGDDADNKWEAVAGRYRLIINAATMTLTVSDGTGLDAKNGDDQTFEAAIPDNVYPIGDATQFGWTPGSSEPIANENDIFDGVVFLKNGEFKLLHQSDWGAQYGPVEAGESITGAGEYTLCKPADDNKWVITGLDNLTAFHMIADPKAGKLILRDTTVVIPPCEVLYMCGDAVGGWSFDDNAIEIHSTDNDSVFHYSGHLYDGEFKFFEKKDFGAQAWGAEMAGMPVTGSGEFALVKLTEDNKFYMTAGEYELTVDLKAGKMTVVYSISSDLENMQNNKAIKRMENGQLIIIRDEKHYNVLGAEL